MALAKGGRIFVHRDLLLTESIQPTILEPSSAIDNGGPNGQVQKTTPAFLPNRTIIAATEITLMSGCWKNLRTAPSPPELWVEIGVCVHQVLWAPSVDTENIVMLGDVTRSSRTPKFLSAIIRIA